MAAIELKANDPEGPRLLIDIFKTALPAGGQPIAGDGIVITGSGQAKYLNISFRSNIAGVIAVTSMVGGVADNKGNCNGGASLTDYELYQATYMGRPGETINLIFSGTGGTYTLGIAEVIQK